MSFPTGTTVYSNQVSTVAVTGLTMTEKELAAIIEKHASAILFDVEATAALQESLSGVAETDFEQQNLEAALRDFRQPQSWEVGEALAQACVAHHSKCSFPWPMRRDQRNPSANQPGGDLVGFQDTGSTKRPHRFAFGEVKTSRQAARPPKVVHGRTGLTQQIGRLRDSDERKFQLMKYLGHRVRGSLWSTEFKSASGRLLASSGDVALFGVLVRDVEPDRRDLLGVQTALAKDCPAGTIIELRAIYLPDASIPGLAQLAKP